MLFLTKGNRTPDSGSALFGEEDEGAHGFSAGGAAGLESVKTENGRRGERGLRLAGVDWRGMGTCTREGGGGLCLTLAHV